jgi:integrase/recombinase XerD
MRSEIEDYVRDLRINPDVAEATHDKRYYDVRSFDTWLTDNDVQTPLTELKPSTVRSYLMQQKQQFSGNTVGKRYDSLNELFGYVLIDYPEKDSPLKPLKPKDFIPGRNDQTQEEQAREEKDLPWHITEQEYRMLLDNCRGPIVRNRCILSLLYHCGLRAGEVRELKFKHIELKDQIITVPKVKTPERYVPLLASTANLLDKYLNHGYRGALENEDKTNDWLFISDQGNKLNTFLVNDMVRAAASKAGIQEVLYEDASGAKRYHIHPHLLRHTFGQRMANERQMPIPVLMKIMGHLDMETAQQYQRQNDKDAAESAKRFMRLSDD